MLWKHDIWYEKINKQYSSWCCYCTFIVITVFLEFYRSFSHSHDQSQYCLWDAAVLWSWTLAFEQSEHILVKMHWPWWLLSKDNWPGSLCMRSLMSISGRVTFISDLNCQISISNSFWSDLRLMKARKWTTTTWQPVFNQIYNDLGLQQSVELDQSVTCYQ